MGKRTALGATALIAGANLPDIDVLAHFAGPGADLEWRRGWTHGILALPVLPFVLTGFLLLVYRLKWVRHRAQPSPLAPKQLLLLSSIAILSHPLLDTLNTYGVRWLMPLSGRWFYGDTLFIIDPWVWIALALGVYYAGRRTRGSRPARLALATVMTYTCIMALSGWAAREVITREVTSLSGKPARSVMAGPVPLDPFVRRFVVEQDQEYRVGNISLAGSAARAQGRPADVSPGTPVPSGIRGGPEHGARPPLHGVGALPYLRSTDGWCRPACGPLRRSPLRARAGRQLWRAFRPGHPGVSFHPSSR